MGLREKHEHKDEQNKISHETKESSEEECTHSQDGSNFWTEIYQDFKILLGKLEHGMRYHYETTHQHSSLPVEHYKQPFVQEDIEEFTNLFKIFQRKFVLGILEILFGMENAYFNEIKAALPKLNSTTLTNHLKLLEENTLVVRTMEDGTPIRVSYALTQKGKEAYLILTAMLFNLWEQ